MIDSASPADRPPDRWEELRALLVDPERERLERLEREVANPHLHTETVSSVLPAAIARRGAHDRELGAALAPVVGEAIGASVRRNPRPLVDAISPVIGPAIRRAISHALGELVQSLNTTLEHTVSLRGLAWRWEALRTGRSFGEVVLSHSLVYRVEQLFLIHRESGLLVEHLTAPEVRAPPPDMVAAMMTALRDFARDSFRVSEQDTLDSLELGALTVWVESGPAAVLAAVIRGRAPLSLRGELQRALEDVHRVHVLDLERSALTGIAFSTQPGLLDRCLVTQAVPRRKGGGWRLAIVGLLVASLIGWLLVPHLVDRWRFRRYLERLGGEPGVVVTDAGHDDGRFYVRGLRDPLARDPSSLLAEARLSPARVEGRWEPYVALRPEFVARRASLLLAPPGGVDLTVRSDSLIATGRAGHVWIAEARRLARAVPGVGVIAFDALVDSARVALEEEARTIEEMRIAFPAAGRYPLPSQRQRLDTLADALRGFATRAAAAGLVPEIVLSGSADSLGTEATNALLRATRSANLRAALVARGVSGDLLRAVPDSSGGPQVHRQVRLRILLGRRQP